MDNVIIYGVGGTGERLYRQFAESKEFNVLCFADSAIDSPGKTKFGLPVIPRNLIKDFDFDYIIIATLPGLEPVTQSLTQEYNIPKEKIIRKYVEIPYESRIAFLKCQSLLTYENNLSGNIAEGGVFQGEFAKYMNRFFPDRKLYLFDTFEGFDMRDVQVEKEHSFSKSVEGYHNITHIDIVKEKMPHKENCIFKKGYFPDSAHDVDDDFVFVNLDFDLYNPTSAGLEFFYPRLVKGGILLVHDYFSDVYMGVKQAVDEFRNKYKVPLCPIGDEISIAILK